MYRIRIKLLSDTTFGRGDGVPGLVDDEIDYDRDTGLPYVKGRAIKGLLVEECANLLFSIEPWVDAERLEALLKSAQRLFGSPGSAIEDEGSLHFGKGQLHHEIVSAVRHTLDSNCTLTADEVLEALTGIRRRSAMDEQFEAPKDETLRSARVLMRESDFYIPLVELQPIKDIDWQLLAGCISSLKRGGKNRNRGSGRLLCALLDEDDNDHTFTLSGQLLDCELVRGNS